MSTIIRSVTNASSKTVSLPIPGYDANHVSVSIASSATLDLFTVLLAEQVEAMQPMIAALIADGTLTSAGTANTALFSPTGVSVLSADPGSPSAGQVWFNTTSHLLKFYDGTTVQTVATA